MLKTTAMKTLPATYLPLPGVKSWNFLLLLATLGVGGCQNLSLAHHFPKADISIPYDRGASGPGTIDNPKGVFGVHPLGTPGHPIPDREETGIRPATPDMLEGGSGAAGTANTGSGTTTPATSVSYGK